jgi:hypothetical protein
MTRTEYAFPFANDADKQYNYINKGITLHDYFAAHALQGLLANPESMKEVRNHETIPGSETDKIAQVADWIARAMMRRREK